MRRSRTLPVAIFGDFAPFISVGLIATTVSELAPSFYVMLAALVSIATLIMVRRLGFR